MLYEMIITTFIIIRMNDSSINEVHLDNFDRTFFSTYVGPYLI